MSLALNPTNATFIGTINNTKVHINLSSPTFPGEFVNHSIENDTMHRIPTVMTIDNIQTLCYCFIATNFNIRQESSKGIKEENNSSC